MEDLELCRQKNKKFLTRKMRLLLSMRDSRTLLRKMMRQGSSGLRKKVEREKPRRRRFVNAFKWTMLLATFNASGTGTKRLAASRRRRARRERREKRRSEKTCILHSFANLVLAFLIISLFTSKHRLFL
jgi:hypothetical protein